MKKLNQIEKGNFVANEELDNIIGGYCPGNQTYYESCSKFSNSCLTEYWNCNKYLFCDVDSPSYMDCPHFVTQCMPIPHYTTCSLQTGYNINIV